MTEYDAKVTARTKAEARRKVEEVVGDCVRDIWEVKAGDDEIVFSSVEGKI